MWKTLHEGVQDFSGGELVTHLCGLTEPDNGESAREENVLIGGVRDESL